MRELRIKEVSNGFVLSWWYRETEDREVTDMVVVEDTGDEHDLFQRFLEKVAEHFGYTYDKWGKENLSITFDRKGHKVE